MSDNDSAKVQDVNVMKRDRWTSRTAFIIAAIGSAIGTGNFWRFPYLTYKHGGGIFFVPYLVALFFFGIPMLIFEVGVGQKFQSGDIGVFGGIHPRIYGIGLCSVYVGFTIVTYYIVLIGWAVYYFFASFAKNLAWAADSKYETMCEGKSAAQTYFYNRVVKLMKDDCTMRDTTETDGVSWLVYLAVVGCWVFTYFAIRRGVKSVSKLVYFTVTIPVILIVIMLIKVSALPGAGEGIGWYLNGTGEKTAIESLSNGTIWGEACG